MSVKLKCSFQHVFKEFDDAQKKPFTIKIGSGMGNSIPKEDESFR